MSFYIYGIASLIGLFLGVISFFYYMCHALCAILFGLMYFIDIYKGQKRNPVSKWSSAYALVIQGYGFGIVCIFYGVMVILL